MSDALPLRGNQVLLLSTLMEIDAKEGVLPGYRYIALRSGVPVNSITPTMDALEEKGYIRRITSSTPGKRRQIEICRRVDISEDELQKARDLVDFHRGLLTDKPPALDGGDDLKVDYFAKASDHENAKRLAQPTYRRCGDCGSVFQAEFVGETKCSECID